MKSLLNRINVDRIYEDDLSLGDKARAKKLLELGLVKAKFGSRSGELFYSQEMTVNNDEN